MCYNPVRVKIEYKIIVVDFAGKERHDEWKNQKTERFYSVPIVGKYTKLKENMTWNRCT